MAIEAWYMDDSDADQREEHRLNPNQPVSLQDLAKVNIYYGMSLDRSHHTCICLPSDVMRSFTI